MTENAVITRFHFSFLYLTSLLSSSHEGRSHLILKNLHVKQDPCTDSDYIRLFYSFYHNDQSDQGLHGFLYSMCIF